MRFTVKHEIKGRIRVQLIQREMTFEEADTLQYYLSTRENVEVGGQADLGRQDLITTPWISENNSKCRNWSRTNFICTFWKFESENCS